MQQRRFEELKAAGVLPSPTGVGLEILRLTRDERASANDIARVIQSDPALTGRTLRLANTGNAASGRPVTNIADAVARLGTRTVSAVALGFTIVAGNRSGRCRGFDFQQFWSQSLAGAVATQVICGHTRSYAGSDGFTAGLLAQIGRLGLASIHPEEYGQILTEWGGGSPSELIRREEEVLVTNHNELSAAMLLDWGLPKSVSQAVLHQENPTACDLVAGPETRELARILNAAARMADICVAPSESDAAVHAPDLLVRGEALGIDAESLGMLLDRVFAQWAEWGRVLDIVTHKPYKLAELIKVARSAATRALDKPAFSPRVPPTGEKGATIIDEGDYSAEAGDRSSELLVLVAEPDAASARFLEKFLVLSGYQVRCATGGHEALQAFFETAPQLVIVDANLPEIGGLEFCRRLRQTSAGRQAYLIMITQPDDEETLIRLFDAGVDDFVTKPFTARPLFARIRASLRVVSLQEKVSLDRDEIQRAHAELAIAHRRLEQDALTDVLTGLPNRRYLVDRLAHDWAAARRSGTPLVCMVIDIDHFKAVNDTWGHDVGDAVLQSVAGVLQREVRGGDVVCRFGGEEFVVVSEADFESARRCAERLRMAIETRVKEEVTALKAPVTVSIGVAVRNDQTRSPQALLKSADEALFCAKRRGRNQVAGTRDVSVADDRGAADEGRPTSLSEPLLDATR